MEPLFDKAEIVTAVAAALKNGAPGLSDDTRAAIITSAVIRLEGNRKAFDDDEIGADPPPQHSEAVAEIARLQELLRSTGANRYWEARWRAEYAENQRLRAALEAARRHISNGYQPPELMDQIEAALKCAPALMAGTVHE